MKALVYTGPEALEYREAPEPQPGAGEVLVQVESVGICGSDMHAYLGHDERRPAPLILGHEVSGTVDGIRMTINPLVTCGACAKCLAGRDNLCPHRQIISMSPREGGFAQRIAIPERNCVRVADHLSPDQAALAEPISCGWHAARIARTHGAGRSGDANALVFGGGAIGVGAALSLRAQGIEDVLLVEPNAERRRHIEQHCDQATAAPDDLPADYAADIVIDGVGIAASRAQASKLVRPGGVIAHIGLGSSEGGLDVRRMTLQEITFVGSYTYTAADFRDTAAAMFDGRLGKLDWIEIRPLADGPRAFDDMRAGRVAAPKIILKPEP